MGVVYKAHDPQIGRDVAIKQIREELDSQELRDRLLREVRATGRLRHPNIVSTFDIGDHGGFPFIVMEFIEGRALDAIIAAGERLPLRTLIDLMAQLCAGLASAHDAGIIHRDVKPANVIVDTAGTVKIVDFGIARLTASATGTVAIGTANYMSPEQWTGHGVDIRTDVFAAGALFYELLSGQKAFPGKSLPEICQRVMNEQPIPLETLCDGLPRQIVEIVNRMLDKVPSNRFESLTPVRTQLLEIHARLTKAEETAYAATVRMRRDELPPAVTTSAPDPGIDFAAVERRRTTQIETHLRVARAAFDRGDLLQAAASCEDVLMLDANQTAALELLRQIRRLQTRGTAEKLSTSNPAVQPAVRSVVQPEIPAAIDLPAQSDDAPAAWARLRNWRPRLKVSVPALVVASGTIRLLMWAYQAEVRPTPVHTSPQSQVASAPPRPTEAPALSAALPPATAAPLPGSGASQPSSIGNSAAAPPSSATRPAPPQRGSATPRATPPPSPSPPPPAPVRVGGQIAPPRRTKDVQPAYPAAAQAARIQGVVILEATIGTTGKVQDARVLRSIPMLDEAALDAVKQWEYTPTLLNGVPVPVIMTVTVNFALKSSGPNVEGLDPDAVTRLLGPPSSTQSDYGGGFRIWYYDRPEGTLTIYFRNGRASLRRPQ